MFFLSLRHPATWMLLTFGLAIVNCAKSGHEPTLRLVEENAFTVSGLPSDQVTALAANPPSEDRWRQMFPVRPVPEGATSLDHMPAMLGRYEVVDGQVRFLPRFPLVPGLTYRARFEGSALVASWPLLTLDATLPNQTIEPTAQVAGIFPSGDQVPQNLLKFYIVFSQPMSRGHAEKHIHLLDEAGTPLDRALLALEQELWDPETVRLTLFLDPGRIKRGLRPHNELGMPLQEGKAIRLVVDAGFPDATGTPLREGAEKRYRVVAVDHSQPDPFSWHLTPPATGSHQPLTLDFVEPLDAALLQDSLAVTTTEGHILEGTITIGEGERQWQFVPTIPWHPITYRLEVRTILEDLAGNNLRKKFDVEVSLGDSLADHTHALLVRTFTPTGE